MKLCKEISEKILSFLIKEICFVNLSIYVENVVTYGKPFVYIFRVHCRRPVWKVIFSHFCVSVPICVKVFVSLMLVYLSVAAYWQFFLVINEQRFSVVRNYYNIATYILIFLERSSSKNLFLLHSLTQGCNSFLFWLITQQ